MNKQAIIERLDEKGENYKEFHPIIISKDGDYVQRLRMEIPHGAVMTVFIMSIADLKAAIEFIQKP